MSASLRRPCVPPIRWRQLLLGGMHFPVVDVRVVRDVRRVLAEIPKRARSVWAPVGLLCVGVGGSRGIACGGDGAEREVHRPAGRTAPRCAVPRIFVSGRGCGDAHVSSYTHSLPSPCHPCSLYTARAPHYPHAHWVGLHSRCGECGGGGVARACVARHQGAVSCEGCRCTAVPERYVLPCPSHCSRPRIHPTPDRDQHPVPRQGCPPSGWS